MSTDWQEVRREFPALANCTWLNSATFGQMPLRAQAAVQRHLDRRNRLGARDFMHWFDQADGVRRDVAVLCHANPDDVAFIPHSSFALSLLIGGMDWREGDEVLTFENEFPNQIYAPSLLEPRGVRLVVTKLDCWRESITERTRVVALSHTNYASGEEAPVAEMAPVLRDHGIVFYVDGTQTAGVRTFDFGAVQPDLYAVNAYKWMNSPPGSGFLLAPARTRHWLQPSSIGWRSHVNWRNVNELHLGTPTLAESAERYEGGMLAFMNLFAMQESLRLLFEVGAETAEARVLSLASAVRTVLREAGAVPLADENPAANGHIVAARLPGRDPVEVARALQTRDVIVSARHGFLRVSPHYYNDEQDIARFRDALREVLPRV